MKDLQHLLPHRFGYCQYVFHKVKFGLRKAFFIYFEMAVSGLAASYTGFRYGVTEKTSRLFMLKVREAMASNGNHPMDREVHVDEFVFGRFEKGKIGRSYDTKKKKAVTAVRLTTQGEVQRIYAMDVEDFSSRSLQYQYIHQQYHRQEGESDHGQMEKVPAHHQGLRYKTDRKCERGQLQVTAHYDTPDKVLNRKDLLMVSDFHINKCFNASCSRINLSQSKATVFNNLITKKVGKEKVYQSKLVYS